eukprot:IDg8122t1
MLPRVSPGTFRRVPGVLLRLPTIFRLVSSLSWWWMCVLYIRASVYLGQFVSLGDTVSIVFARLSNSSVKEKQALQGALLGDSFYLAAFFASVLSLGNLRPVYGMQ